MPPLFAKFVKNKKKYGKNEHNLIYSFTIFVTAKYKNIINLKLYIMNKVLYHYLLSTHNNQRVRDSYFTNYAEALECIYNDSQEYAGYRFKLVKVVICKDGQCDVTVVLNQYDERIYE